MKRLILTATLIAIGGLATAASAADQNEIRSVAVYGRSVVWHQPSAERPYALRGESRDIQSHKPRAEFRIYGRAGMEYQVNRDTAR